MLSQCALVLNGPGSQRHRIFVFFKSMVEDFFLFVSGLPAIDKVRKIEFCALPDEAHGVDQPSERVGGNAVNPRASVIDGNLVVANEADVCPASYPIIGLKNEYRTPKVLQLLRRAEPRQACADDDYVISVSPILPVGRAIRVIERRLRESCLALMRVRYLGMDRCGQQNPGKAESNG